ncbi:hypothetical protein [Mycetocola sp. 2940]|uniref:hypothetical protein n=1 Tax=Mycetocola sp. 2940 TaxID=3156452 RepID=UPI0033920CAB
MLEKRLNAPASRWISVTFLQGEDADEVLGIINRGGAPAAIAHLRSLDHGEETTDAALTNGYVYDSIPAGSTDQTIEDPASPYVLTYSVHFRYVSLLRRHPVESESEPALTPGPSPTQPAQPRQRAAGVWNTTRSRSTNAARHTVAL